MCADLCVDMCIDMCLDMRVGMCADVCADVCTDMCIDMVQLSKQTDVGACFTRVGWLGTVAAQRCEARRMCVRVKKKRAP